jgi:uncharacterized protein YjbJ (UPF0337 family)
MCLAPSICSRGVCAIRAVRIGDRYRRRRNIMNWDRIEGNWKQFKGKAKQKWGQLTDDDLDRLAGKRDELIGKIQERKGIARDKAEKEVNEWASSL